jgi:hypothetical protein
MEVEATVYRNGKPYRPEQEVIAIEDMAEYLRTFFPKVLNSLSTEEICAMDRGNIERSVEIIEKYGIAEDIVSNLSKELMEGHEIYVLDSAISRMDDDMIIDLYCLPDSE